MSKRPATVPAIFVVSLPRSAARRAPLLAVLHDMGLTAEVVLGIDAAPTLPPECEPLVDRKGARSPDRRPLVDPEFGCALSHLAAFRLVLERGLEDAVVLEDDARPAAGFAAVIALPMPPGAQLLTYDYDRCRVRRGSCRAYGPDHRVWRIAANPARATGYRLTAAAARCLIAAQTPVRGVADWPMDLHALAGHAIWPRVVDHPPDEDTTSSITPQRNVTHVLDRKSRRRFFQRAYWRRKLGRYVYPDGSRSPPSR